MALFLHFSDASNPIEWLCSCIFAMRSVHIGGFVSAFSRFGSAATEVLRRASGHRSTMSRSGFVFSFSASTKPKNLFILNPSVGSFM